jgi:1-acyl-sn-glycerol-3-phosphate acyltransferase
MTNAFESHYDAAFFARTARVLDPLTRFWFRYRLRGTDRLPTGPCLLVGNHSGLGTAEILSFVGGWHRAFGTERRLTGLMHDLFLKTPGLGHFYRAIGAIPAAPDNARRALEAGHAVLVYPGGDLDACRPFYQPREVIFGRRRGYVRVALEMGIPVVPLATIGSHYTWLMLPGGLTVSRVLGLKRLIRSERFPLPAGIAAALAAGVAAQQGWLSTWAALAIAALGLLPNPVRITSEFLLPLDLASCTRHCRSEQERTELAHRIVHGALQNAVRAMRHEGDESTWDHNRVVARR